MQQVVEVQASKQSSIEFMAKDSSTNKVSSSKQSVGLELGRQKQQQHWLPHGHAASRWS